MVTPLRLLGEVQDELFYAAGEFIDQLAGTWVLRLSHAEDVRDFDDLVDIAGAQEHGLAGVQRFGGLVLP
jgi:hypothetical protein